MDAIAATIESAAYALGRASANLLQAQAQLRALAEQLSGQAGSPVAAAAPAPQPTAAPAPRAPMGKYRLHGEPITARELAAKAGCTEVAMIGRLQRGMTPEAAIAAGARKTRSDCKTARPAPAVAAPAPAFPRSVFDPRPAPRPAMPSLQPAAFKPGQQAIIPPDVKRTIAPTPRDTRFTVDSPEPTFSARPPGKYDETGSALERAYGSQP